MSTRSHPQGFSLSYYKRLTALSVASLFEKQFDDVRGLKSLDDIEFQGSERNLSRDLRNIDNLKLC